MCEIPNSVLLASRPFSHVGLTCVYEPAYHRMMIYKRRTDRFPTAAFGFDPDEYQSDARMFFSLSTQIRRMIHGKVPSAPARREPVAQSRASNDAGGRTQTPPKTYPTRIAVACEAAPTATDGEE